jgi:lipid-A-disaccharide synthase-like uncharacterized protein
MVFPKFFILFTLAYKTVWLIYFPIVSLNKSVELEMAGVLAFGGEILGVAGAFLVVVAWLFEVKQIIKTRHSSLDWNFGSIYLAGTLLLVAYSIQINSAVFAILNFLAALLALTCLYVKWNEKVRKGRK